MGREHDNVVHVVQVETESQFVHNILQLSCNLEQSFNEIFCCSPLISSLADIADR